MRTAQLVEECIPGLEVLVLREVESLMFPKMRGAQTIISRCSFFLASLYTRRRCLPLYLSLVSLSFRGRGEQHTQVRRSSLRQKLSFRIQLANITAVSLVSPAPSNPPTASRVVVICPSGARSTPTNRVVSQSILHPSVPVSRICDVSGGRRR